MADRTGRRWPGCVECCQERGSLDLTRFSPTAARTTDADSRIGTWLMFNKDHGANGLVSKSGGWWLRVAEVWGT